MPVYLATAAAAIFYAMNVPVFFAFSLRIGEGNRLKVAIGAFTGPAVWRDTIALSFEALADWVRNRMNGKAKPRLEWKKAALYAIRHVELEGARIHLRLGADDAAHTALICGAVQAAALAANAAGRLDIRARVEPVFGERALAFEAGGILSMRVGHIIGAISLLGIDTVRRKLKDGKASD